MNADATIRRVWTRREAIASLLTAPFWPSTSQRRTPTSNAADDLVWLDVAGIARTLAARELTVFELTDLFLQRIARVDPSLRAFVTVTPERAREDARRLDDAARKDGIARPLAGVPVAHKDLFETAGIRTTAGSKLFERHVPTRDATVVARLAAAGCVLVGKTNTHELGGGVTTINPFFGTTANPWNIGRIAGGSSGGSAAAVAAGLTVLATGSDTGGSVRIPAALCGCVGFKPTFGRVSTAGLLGAAPTFDHSGIIARTVGDVAAAYQAVAGYDAADSTTGPTDPARNASARTESTRTNVRLAGVRVGIARNFFFEGTTASVATAVERSAATMRSMGAAVRDLVFPIDEDTMARIFDPIIVAEIHHRFARDWKERPEAFSPSFAGFFQAPVPSGLELVDAHRSLLAFQAAVRHVFETVDVVMMPTVPIVAPPIGGPIDGARILRNTWPFNAARTPAITVPCGLDAEGLPIGAQLVAAPYDDNRLLTVAGALDAAMAMRRRPALAAGL
jgi:aspartyl-tRNA(Asn)/glutamyl-tRNA(Gln) amidotransferase subunit A